MVQHSEDLEMLVLIKVLRYNWRCKEIIEASSPRGRINQSSSTEKWIWRMKKRRSDKKDTGRRRKESRLYGRMTTKSNIQHKIQDTHRKRQHSAEPRLRAIKTCSLPFSLHRFICIYRLVCVKVLTILAPQETMGAAISTLLGMLNSVQVLLGFRSTGLLARRCVLKSGQTSHRHFVEQEAARI